MLMDSSIRPLMRAEIRARTLTGRHQISDGGQHLVDGVPFGRPYLRQPNRPAVRIPPRKRQRLEEITDDEEGRLLMETQQEDQEESEALVDESALVTATPGRKSRGAQKTVHFKQPEVEMELDEDSEDEDDDDFAPDEESDEVDVNASDDSDSDSDSTDSSSASDASDSDSDSDSSSDDSSSDSDSDSESDSDAAPEVRSSKVPVPKTAVTQSPTNLNMSPPGEGKKTTQSRNARRTKTNRLKHLKEAGKLHKDADLKDLERHEEELRLQQNGEQLEQRQSFAQPAGKRKRIEDGEATQPAIDEAAELEKRKQEMIAKFGQESDVTMEAEEPASSKTKEAISASPQQESKEPAATPENFPERKRLRPDVSAIGRMLARQTKNLVKKPVKAKEPTPEPEGSTDPDFWKSRINLSAFECWEEEYELTAPPFPFQQHWDPVSKVMRDAAKKKKGKKGGKKLVPVQEPEEEEEEEEKIFLNYDDTPDDDNPDVEIHAAIEDQLQQDIATASQEQSHLPPLPEDLSTLPDLTSADIKAGAVIACKFFGVNPVTVTPEISDFKTAVVEREGDSGAGAGTIRLRIAKRDLPKKEKKFNSKGERVYDAKDGFFMDEEEEEGLWSGMFGELLEGKLLKAA